MFELTRYGYNTTRLVRPGLPPEDIYSGTEGDCQRRWISVVIRLPGWLYIRHPDSSRRHVQFHQYIQFYQYDQSHPELFVYDVEG